MMYGYRVYEKFDKMSYMITRSCIMKYEPDESTDDDFDFLDPDRSFEQRYSFARRYSTGSMSSNQHEYKLLKEDNIGATF